MTNKQFWQSASNRGLICGAALFVMNLIGWGLKLEEGGTWLYELLLFIVICPLIIFTARKNAKLSGAEGYPYGRAVGFVFAMMLFAGIVYGVGRYLMINFIAIEYYEALNSKSLDTALQMYYNTPMYDQILAMRETALGWLRNPLYLIFSEVFNLAIKGGFLGLILCAFLYTKPDLFAAAQAQESQTGDNENGGE